MSIYRDLHNINVIVFDYCHTSSKPFHTPLTHHMPKCISSHTLSTLQKGNISCWVNSYIPLIWLLVGWPSSLQRDQELHQIWSDHIAHCTFLAVAPNFLQTAYHETRRYASRTTDSHTVYGLKSTPMCTCNGNAQVCAGFLLLPGLRTRTARVLLLLLAQIMLLLSMVLAQ